MLELLRPQQDPGPRGAAPPAALQRVATHELAGADGQLLRASLLQFDREAFDVAAFDAWGIERPTTIARSVMKRQAEFFFGRLAARLAMLALGRPGVPIPIGPSHQPLWPQGLVGSISHSHDLAAALVLEQARARAVGIDVEKIVSGTARDALLAFGVDASEAAYLRALSTRDLPFEALLTLVFSAKESLFKGAFEQVGRYFDFLAARVSDIDWPARRMTLVLREHLCAEYPRGRRCPVSFDFLRQDMVFTAFVREASGASDGKEPETTWREP